MFEQVEKEIPRTLLKRPTASDLASLNISELIVMCCLGKPMHVRPLPPGGVGNQSSPWFTGNAVSFPLRRTEVDFPSCHREHGERGLAVRSQEHAPNDVDGNVIWEAGCRPTRFHSTRVGYFSSMTLFTLSLSLLVENFSLWEARLRHRQFS